jgi:hypothetical protein
MKKINYRGFIIDEQVVQGHAEFSIAIPKKSLKMWSLSLETLQRCIDKLLKEEDDLRNFHYVYNWDSDKGEDNDV